MSLSLTKGRAKQLKSENNSLRRAIRKLRAELRVLSTRLEKIERLAA